jgi:dTDP-4-dehydrorhamnose reductase
MTRIAILGANGQLGSDLGHALAGRDTVLFTRADFDVTDHSRTRTLLEAAAAGVIVNTTAYHRVDDCETQAETAYAVNVLALLNLVRVANDTGALLVHFSTDYVFDGAASEPYTEQSPAMPLSVYGNSKLAGEYLVRTTAKRYLLIRSAGLYGIAGSRGKGGNFVETMLAKAAAGGPIQVVSDQVTTPTWTANLAAQVVVMLDNDFSGLCHATNDGSCSWYEFAQAVFELSGIAAPLAATTSDVYRTAAVRPRYSVLENARLKQAGLNCMPHWREALTGYLAAKRSRKG